MNELAPTAPRWKVTRRPLESADDPHGDAEIDDVPVLGESSVDDARADVQVAGAKLELHRASRSAVLRTRPGVSPERLVHPVLAPLAITAAHWSGWVPLHASAVIVDGVAWAILAERGEGKTTTVAALEQAGFGVVADDLLVIDDHLSVHAGPRAIDLRASSAHLFSAAERVDDYPTRERFRLTTRPIPATVPLAGFIRLVWSDHRAELTSVPIPHRLPSIGAAVSMGGTLANPGLMLELATRPAFYLERPRDLEAIAHTVDLIAGLSLERR